MVSKAKKRKVRMAIVASEMQFCENYHAMYEAIKSMVHYGYTRDDLINGVKEMCMYGYMSPMAKREKSVYIDFFSDLSWVYMDRAKQMMSAPEEMLLMYIEQVKEEPIYRIEINEDHTVQTTCYELLDAFDPELKNYYETLDDLPKWVQDKLAVLMLLDHTKVNEEVKGVGRRISKNVYWVFHGEIDGNNPRREG